jgi:hypothetical protein
MVAVRRRTILAVLVIIPLLAAAAVTYVAQAGAGDEWACDAFATTSFTLAGETGGLADPEAALREGVEILAQDGVADGSAMLAALERRSGPDRLDPTSGELFLDGKVRVQFGLSKLTDGTWALGRMKYCPGIGDVGAPSPSGG